MQRSASTGSPLAAAGLSAFAHVPKRAVQHGIFLSSQEVAPTQLKPGQTSLWRQVEYEEPDYDPNAPRESAYTGEFCKPYGVEVYKNPVKPIKQGQPPAGYGHHNTAHWKSNYNSTHNKPSIDGALYHRQHGPSYQAANPPTCVGQPLPHSTFQEYHGRYGENPRDRVHPSGTSMMHFQNVLTAGTHKGTNHIPGYSGFMATNTANPQVARVAGGATLRSVDKTNLTAQFHTNLLNYAGHVPDNPHNDKGGVQPNNMTMMHRSFTAPRLNTFD